MKRQKLQLVTENHELKTKLTFVQDELDQMKTDVCDASYKLVLGLIDNDNDLIQQALDILDKHIY